MFSSSQLKLQEVYCMYAKEIDCVCSVPRSDIYLHVVDIRDRARVGDNTNLHVVAYCEIVFSATHRAGNIECKVQSLGSDRPS